MGGYKYPGMHTCMHSRPIHTYIPLRTSTPLRALPLHTLTPTYPHLQPHHIHIPGKTTNHRPQGNGKPHKHRGKPTIIPLRYDNTVFISHHMQYETRARTRDRKPNSKLKSRSEATSKSESNPKIYNRIQTDSHTDRI